MWSIHDVPRTASGGRGRLTRFLRAVGWGERLLVVSSVSLMVMIGAVSAAQASTPGTISTLAGQGGTIASQFADGELASSSQLFRPYGSAGGVGGDVLIANTYAYGVALVAGADCASDCPYGLSSTLEGHIYAVAGDRAEGYSGDGGPALSADLSLPVSVVVDEGGDIVIVDNQNERVRLVARSSCASECPYGLPSMTRGYIYTVAGDGTAGYSGDSGPATGAELNDPTAVAVDQYGDLLIGDTHNQRVRLVAGSNCAGHCPYGLASLTKGYIYTVAGDGTAGFGGDDGSARSAKLSYPTAVTIDGIGDLLIADTGNNRVRLVADSSCASDCQYGLRSMTPGDIYTVAGTATSGYSGDGGPADLARLSSPQGLAVDGVGDLLIDDTNNNRVRLVPDIGCSTDCDYGLSGWLGKGFIYTAAGDGMFGEDGNNGPATSAQLTSPLGLGVDNAGDLLIADPNASLVQIVTASQPPPVCYETGIQRVGQDGFTGDHDQEGVIVYAPAGLASITQVTVVNGTANHSAFTSGTTGPVLVTAAKTAQTTLTSGYYKATDDLGRSTYCGFYVPSTG
jgi:hypothetical protein